jgi:hypothetical protein
MATSKISSNRSLEDQLQQARAKLASIEKIKADANKRYLVDGKLLTETGYKKVISDLQSKIDDLVFKINPPEVQTEAEAAAQRDLLLGQSEKLQVLLQSVSSRRKELENAVKREGTASAQDNLNSWLVVYRQKEKELTDAIGSLGEGTPVAVLPVAPPEISNDKARVTPASGVSAPVTTTTTTAPGVGGAFAPPTAPRSPRPTAAQTTTTAQTGPQLSETALSTWKAGQNVGGADRKLSNGGAVVNGIYIPPGLNFGGTQTKPGATSSPTGGGMAGGTQTGTQTGTQPSTPAVIPADWEQAAQEQYGGYYAIVKSIPEVATLLQNAVANDWSNEKFQYELSQTTWFKTTSSSARAWDLSEQSDPASAQQKVDNQAAQIKAKALTLGIRLDDTSVAKLAKDSLRGGWDETTITNSIGSQAMQSTAGVSQLRSGYIGQTLRQTAADYGISLSDDTFNQFVNKVATGQESQNSFQQYALQMAKSLFPGIAAQLDAGQTYKQIVDPYKQTAAQILEMNPENIDFVDPKWSKAVTFVTDKGEQRPMNYNEWGDYLRQTRSFGYEFTSEAQTRAYGVANDLARLFGKA